MVTHISLFQTKQVRRHFDPETDRWYFSIVDVVAILTESADPQNYWKVLKNRLNKEGSEVVTKCNHLKMTAADGKKYLTDCFSTEDLLRMIQSIPSKNAEPFKVWLAKVGYERIEETEDPELAFDRAMMTYLRKGYSREWISQRLKSIEVRKELTNEWGGRGVQEGREFAILTDEITRAWSGKSVREYKNFKGLKKESLRDNMTNIELVLTMLGEASTTEIARGKDAQGFNQNKRAAVDGGSVAGNARKELEKKSGKKVVSNKRFTDHIGSTEEDGSLLISGT